MLYYAGGDLATWIYMILFFIAVASCCCLGEGSSSKGTVNAKKRNATPTRKKNAYHNHHAYSECPSCGAPYYDGFCDECGYPDVNQGWLGEEF
jgi:hypothetical protein